MNAFICKPISRHRHTAEGPDGNVRNLKTPLRLLWITGLAIAAALFALASSGHVQAQQRPVRILALGDSLTAGYQLPQEDGFTAKLEARLRAAGYDAEVINAGVSGDTSAGGLARLDWLLDGTLTHAIVELGANDALRGLEPAETQANLDAILTKLKAAKIEVLLAGMLAPPNLGPDYEAAFNAVYPRLAEKHGLALYPFFLDGVAAEPHLNLADGIHPNAEGVEVIVERILPHISRLIEAGASKPTPPISE